MDRSSKSVALRERRKRLKLLEETTAAAVTPTVSSATASAYPAAEVGSPAEIEEPTAKKRKIEEIAMPTENVPEKAQGKTSTSSGKGLAIDLNRTEEGMIPLYWPEDFNEITRKMLETLKFPHFQSKERWSFFYELWNRESNKSKIGLGLHNPDSYNDVIIGNEMSRGTPVLNFIRETGLILDKRADEIDISSTKEVTTETTSDKDFIQEIVATPIIDRIIGSEIIQTSAGFQKVPEDDMVEVEVLTTERDTQGPLIEVIPAVVEEPLSMPEDNVEVPEEERRVEVEAVDVSNEMPVQDKNTTSQDEDLAEVVIVPIQESSVTSKDEDLAMKVTGPEQGEIPSLLPISIDSLPATEEASTSSELEKNLSVIINGALAAGGALQTSMNKIISIVQTSDEKSKKVESDIHKLQSSVHFLKNVGAELDDFKKEMKGLSQECADIRDEHSHLAEEISDLNLELSTYKEGYSELVSDFAKYKRQMQLEMNAVYARLVSLEFKNVTGDPNLRET